MRVRWGGFGVVTLTVCHIKGTSRSQVTFATLVMGDVNTPYVGYVDMDRRSEGLWSPSTEQQCRLEGSKEEPLRVQIFGVSSSR